MKIKERSAFARMARLVLKSRNVAMVLGKTIHLSGVSREAFLADKPWVAHELCHVQQFADHGFFRFLVLYLVESVKHGYYNNRFEVAARQAGAWEARKQFTENRDQVAVSGRSKTFPAEGQPHVENS